MKRGLLTLFCVLTTCICAVLGLCACGEYDCTKKGHSYGDWTTVSEATCTTEGNKIQICKHCAKIVTQEISATGEHTYGEWETVVESTCMQKGSQTKTCSVCGEVQTQEISATGVHTYGEWETVVEPTANADGAEIQICKHCAKVNTEVIPAEGQPSGGTGGGSTPSVADGLNGCAHVDNDGDGLCDFCEWEIVESSVWDFLFEETEDGTGYAVSYYYGTDRLVVIPSHYNGKPVVAVGTYVSDATSDGYQPDLGYNRLGMPFAGNSSAKYLVLPNTAKELKDYAFYNSAICAVTIPNSVTNIGRHALGRCIGLTSVMIGNGVTSIGDYAFLGCSGLTSIVIPDGVTSIGSSAFGGCSGLTSIVIPDSVTSIGDFVFNGCSKLTSVYYHGTAEEWEKIIIEYYNDNLTSATRYYYSATEPTGEGNYWHYDTDGKTPIVWE